MFLLTQNMHLVWRLSFGADIPNQTAHYQIRVNQSVYHRSPSGCSAFGHYMGFCPEIDYIYFVDLATQVNHCTLVQVAVSSVVPLYFAQFGTQLFSLFNKNLLCAR